MKRIDYEHMGLIIKALQDMKLIKYEDEYLDVGFIGLTRGLNTFDESKNIQLSTYLTTCIRYELIKTLKYNNALKRKSSLNDISIFTPTKDDGTLRVIDIIPSNENIENELIKQNIFDIVHEEVNKLSERQKYAIEVMFFGKKRTDKCTRQYWNSVKRLALKELKKKLKRRGIYEDYFENINSDNCCDFNSCISNN